MAKSEGGSLSVRNVSLIYSRLHLGNLPCWLGDPHTVTTHRPNSSSWVGSRDLKVKVMVGATRVGEMDGTKVRAGLDLGPGETTGRSGSETKALDGGAQCRKSKGTMQEPVVTNVGSSFNSGTACEVLLPKASRPAGSDEEGRRGTVGRT